jgi:hypothetical protein
MKPNEQALAEHLIEVMKTGDFEAIAQAEYEVSADDIVLEWPQSGERIRGRDKVLRLVQAYAASTGTQPAFTHRRTLGGGALWVTEGTIDYGDGVPWHTVHVVEVRDEKIDHVTEYFAAPFEAPEWRRQFTTDEGEGNSDGTA